MAIEAEVLVLLVLLATGGLAELISSSTSSMRDYLQERGSFLREEHARYLGANLTLNPAEEAFNVRLMAIKKREYNVSEKYFPPARHFFRARKDIENSEIFKIIRKMPKGALLHAHDFAMANVEFVVRNVTYMPNLWATNSYGTLTMKFASPTPGAGWVRVSDLRAQFNATEFDKILHSQFTLTVADPEAAYPDQDSVWAAFESRFILLFSILRYKPAFRSYFWQTLTEYYEDNVMYVEMRAALPELYDLSGRLGDVVETATLYRDIAEEFRQQHPDFQGVRLIYAPSRHVAVKQMHEYITDLQRLKTALPDFLIGFDLVAHEDEGRPLIDFAQGLLELRSLMPEIKFFFHAGETNWEASSSDNNLIDALLLNTTRIGHGYAMVKHPKVMEEVKRRGVGIEVSPISNQVLGLVNDIRNHPGALLLADDYPVIISSDDPGMWDATGLSYDFYQAFLGMSGMQADLRLLKQLALNSIKYSSLSLEERRKAFNNFNQRWKNFITDIIPNRRIWDTNTDENSIPERNDQSMANDMTPQLYIMT